MKILIKVTKDVLAITANCPGFADATIEVCEIIRKNCAIAYAVRQLIPNAQVAETRIHFGDYNAPLCQLPPEASEFIERFDNLTPMERVQMDPISFEVDLPDWYIDTIGISEAYRILSESKTLELVMPK